MTAHDRTTDDGSARGLERSDPWLHRQAGVLRQALGWAGWHVPVSTAAWIVQDRVDHAVAQSGLPQDVVRDLLEPEHVRGMASTIAATLADERREAGGGTARLDGPLGDSFRRTG